MGTDLTGKSAGPGNLYGILIDGGSRNTIGGAGSLGNLISGNTGAGVQIQDNVQLAQNNLVIGNKIGTDVTGIAALPNQGDGVTDNFDSNNTIGGTTTGSGNLISANLGQGISLYGASGDLVAGNIVGTTAGQITDSPFKFQPLGNGGDGIRVSLGSTNNMIGLPGRATLS